MLDSLETMAYIVLAVLFPIVDSVAILFVLVMLLLGMIIISFRKVLLNSDNKLKPFN